VDEPVRARLPAVVASGLFLLGCGDSPVPEGVVLPAQPSPARVVAVEVVGSTQLFARGQTQQFTARARYSNGFVEDRTTVATWQSDNSAVASVSSVGIVTAGNEGKPASARR
jgi:hypothetical protein